MSTQQETFNTVVNALRKQGCKSSQVNEPDNCLYHGPSGLKCAAGHLIPDEEYNENFEGTPLLDGLSEKPTIVGNIIRRLGHDIHLVQKLQIIHDNDEVEKWEAAFARLADKFNLVYTSSTVEEGI